MTNIIIAVDLTEMHALEELRSAVSGASDVVQAKPFDGVTTAQVLLPLTIAAVPVVKAWIGARSAHKKSQTVVLRGMRFEGYSAKEVAKLYEVLDQEVTPKLPDDEHREALRD